MSYCDNNPSSFECKAYRKRPKRQPVNYHGRVACSEKNITGPGTPHPIGLSESEIIKITHRVQRLNVNIVAIPDGVDALTQFLAAGGSTGGLIGAINALGSIQQAEPIVFAGKSFPQHTETYERICGQKHILTKNGRISIDTGKLVYKNRLYWPEIKIDIYSGISGGTIATSHGQGAELRGGVTFEPLGALIKMYFLPTSDSIFSGKLDSVLGSFRIDEEVKGDWSLKKEINDYELGNKSYAMLTDLAKHIVDTLNL